MARRRPIAELADPEPEEPGDALTRELSAAVARLRSGCMARAAFLVDADGTPLATAGDLSDEGASGAGLAGLDLTRLGALFAANKASSEGVAALLRERGFATQVLAGEESSVHVRLIADSWILAAVFDHRTSPGLVRLVAGRVAEELAELRERRGVASTQGLDLDELTEEFFEMVFGDGDL